MENIFGILIKIVIFIVSLGLIIVGQRNIGYPGLGMMMVGLVGILSLLYVYNKAHQ